MWLVRRMRCSYFRMVCRYLRKSIGVASKTLLCQRFADLVSRLSDADDAPTGGCLTIQYEGYDQ